ncbi:MAG: hypothetical protein QG583_402 [Patescibacteria group bacterium]|nr:hypothetical protein [Patescibacteria group bacterium]
MEGDFKIEDAKPEDVETMINIKKARWLEIYPNEKYGIATEDLLAIDYYNPESLIKRKSELKEVRNDTHTFVIKDNENKIVGYCKVSKMDDYGEINAIYTLPGFEGKGLGKKLIQKAFEWLGSSLDIKLKVVAYNTNAIGFYEKFGFKKTTTVVDYGGTQLPSGKEIPRIEMFLKRI